jgi:hypothetical protein
LGKIKTTEYKKMKKKRENKVKLVGQFPRKVSFSPLRQQKKDLVKVYSVQHFQEENVFILSRLLSISQA